MMNEVVVNDSTIIHPSKRLPNQMVAKKKGGFAQYIR